MIINGARVVATGAHAAIFDADARAATAWVHVLTAAGVEHTDTTLSGEVLDERLAAGFWAGRTVEDHRTTALVAA